jgi:hypothetical protein
MSDYYHQLIEDLGMLRTEIESGSVNSPLGKAFAQKVLSQAQEAVKELRVKGAE